MFLLQGLKSLDILHIRYGVDNKDAIMNTISPVEIAPINTIIKATNDKIFPKFLSDSIIFILY